MSKEQDALLPCPFCGSGKITTLSSKTPDMTMSLWTAFCADCEAEGPHEVECSEAIAGWNRRSASQAAHDVLAERRRQIEAEGWTPEHDDAHSKGEMARAAACYSLGWIPRVNDVVAYRGRQQIRGPVPIWPWNGEWWKPRDRRRDLVRAGALILAEIERLDRKEGVK